MRGLVLLSSLGATLACQTGCVYSPIVHNSSTIVGSYNGTVNVTVSGKSCCPWLTSNSSAGIVAGKNYCRNYGEDLNVYCYSGDCANPTREYCDVGSFGCPICQMPTFAPTPAGSLSYPCIAPQALVDTGTTFATRIVGGQNAIPHEFPFFVSVQKADGTVLCGGSLIHEDWIMTAQHCTFDDMGELADPSYFSVKIGAQNSDDTDACVEVRSVVQILRVPAYNGIHNDIAFFELSASSAYPPIILNRVGLSSENLEATGLMMTIIGHGAAREGGPAVRTLQKATVPITNQTTCEAFYSAYGLDDANLCTGYQAGTVDTCQGDSGGPLFVKRGTDFIQIGVTASGVGCAGFGTPGIAMRVSKFHYWICGTNGLPQEICSRSLSTDSPTTSRPTTPFPTLRPTTSRPTTRVPTTKSPTTRAPTKSPTTKSPTTSRPTTRFPTTKSPTTKAPTKSPTTKSPTRSPTTKSPTTKVPTTSRPTTRAPTTKVPTTKAPTKSPTTKSPTKAPTTKSPTTRVPTTSRPTTRAPTTKVPTTKAPTKSPTTKSPTKVPTTKSPTTRTPTTSRPTTKVPTTKVPTTKVPTKSPTTKSPTKVPTTKSPTTRVPTTSRPTTKAPTTKVPTTKAPTKSPTTKSPTGAPTTKSPVTRSPTRSPTTRSPTKQPTTRQPTLKPTTRQPTTRQPTFKPTTRSPTLRPTTRQPTLKPTTPFPTTRGPTTAQPTAVSR